MNLLDFNFHDSIYRWRYCSIGWYKTLPKWEYGTFTKWTRVFHFGGHQRGLL